MVHPCRAILVVLDDDTPSRAVEQPLSPPEPGGGRAVLGGDRIVAPPRAVHQAMSAASTVVLPARVQTWWPGVVAFDGDLYNHVVEVSDRVLLDTARFREPRSSLVALAGAIEVTHESIAFGDLSWARINPWRALTAELFDAPADQEMIHSIERVVVEYAARRMPTRASRRSSSSAGHGGQLAEGRARGGAPGAWLVDGVRPVEVRIAQRPPARPDADARPALSHDRGGRGRPPRPLRRRTDRRRRGGGRSSTTAPSSRGARTCRTRMRSSCSRMSLGGLPPTASSSTR